LRDGPGEDLVGLNKIRCLAQTIADAARGAERLGDQAHAPTESKREPRTGKEIRHDRRQIDLDERLRAREPQRLCELDIVGVHRLCSLPDIGDDQRQRRHQHDEDRGCLRKTEPDDGEDRRKRRKTRPTEVDDSAAYDDSIHNLPPDAAFRESLFDAMADDEGATFWESVYGQPIHNYPKSYVDQETGELEQMDDEEYAQYVRRKMWEKSWEGIEAQREERVKAQRAKERSRKEEAGRGPGKAGLHNGRTFDFEVEESLRRGEERRQRKRWKTLWDDYLQRWISLQRLIDDKSTDSADAQQTSLRNKIAWPVESGRRDDVSPAQIENFVLNGAKNANPDLDHETALLSALKVERVRWHPDKIQQRFGSLGIDEKTMKGVTAVFQVIDRMWNERKEQR